MFPNAVEQRQRLQHQLILPQIVPAFEQHLVLQTATAATTTTAATTATTATTRSNHRKVWQSKQTRTFSLHSFTTTTTVVVVVVVFFFFFFFFDLPAAPQAARCQNTTTTGPFWNSSLGISWVQCCPSSWRPSKEDGRLLERPNSFLSRIFSIHPFCCGGWSVSFPSLGLEFVLIFAK